MTNQPEATGNFTPSAVNDDVVVGIDGSETSATALTWALREAQLRGARLRLITAYGMPLLDNTGMASAYHEVLGKLRDAAAGTVTGARTRAIDQGVEVSGATVEGDAAGALMKASETAGLLVVGSRGLGGFAGRMLGSVSSALPGQVHCPLVVIPGAETKGRHKNRNHGAGPVPTGVVAGIDGSEHAAAAALTAAEYAMRRDLALTIIWARPPVESYIPMPMTDWEIRGLQSYVDGEATWLIGHFPDLDVTAQFCEGAPVETLTGASDTADLVVLGNRGRGGFASLVLGSTSQSVVHQARGPVMIVPNNTKNPDPRLSNRIRPIVTGEPSGTSTSIR